VRRGACKDATCDPGEETKKTNFHSSRQLTLTKPTDAGYYFKFHENRLSDLGAAKKKIYVFNMTAVARELIPFDL